MGRIMKFVLWVAVSIAAIATIVVFEINSWPAGNSVCGVFLGFILPQIYYSFKNLFDASWKASQRNLERRKIINQDTVIRVSFAYLFRIKFSDKYFLVPNTHHTGKYQPVGGVYKFEERERMTLTDSFHIIDDQKIPITESSRNDYRLQMKNKYLRRFVKRFEKGINRESISDLSREFREEMVKTGLVNWTSITYRYCGRKYSDIKFSEPFQIYELHLADVVELIPTPEQLKDLDELFKKKSNKYIFATTEQIKKHGVNMFSNDCQERIGDHTKNTLQENEDKLVKPMRKYRRQITVSLKESQ